MEQKNKLKLNSGGLLVFILTVGVFGIINTEMGVVAVSYTHLDVKVANNPETVVKGEDTQLKVAVDELLKEIDSQKK